MPRFTDLLNDYLNAKATFDFVLREVPESPQSEDARRLRDEAEDRLNEYIEQLKGKTS